MKKHFLLTSLWKGFSRLTGLKNQPIRTHQTRQFFPYPSLWPADAAFVRTIDGPGYRMGNRSEKAGEFAAPERKEQARDMDGIVSLADGVEHFRYPRMLFKAS